MAVPDALASVVLHSTTGRFMMTDWTTMVKAAASDTSMGEAFGPYAALAFLALGAALCGVTLAVMVRGVLDQFRGPRTTTRPAAVTYGLHPEDEAATSPAPAT